MIDDWPAERLHKLKDAMREFQGRNRQTPDDSWDAHRLRGILRRRHLDVYDLETELDDGK